MSNGYLKSALVQSAVVLLILSTVSISPTRAGLHPSYDHKAPLDTVPFYPGATYDASIPHPDEVLPFPVGKWPNRYDDIIRYIETLAVASDRVIIEPHERTYEGRQLYNVLISTPENMQSINEHRANMARLADPATITAGEVDAAVLNQPAFAWMGYSIHGDEISGADAAAMLCYHLAAATDSATMHLLQNVIIIIDPSENPDGRERYLSMLQTYKSHVPNYDRYAAQHRGVWPWGRGNHYWFDLNRDWILLRHPETRGRVQTILKYNPVLVVDAHEMGSDETFLFTPPRQPINYNTPESVLKWWNVFSADQAEAFDQRGWPYYIGEWHEQWYPGYGSAWATFFGAVGILYEQAGVDGEFVRQPDDYILTYHESVNHQLTSSLANLFTTANNRVQLLGDYSNTRRNLAEQGRRSGLTFVFAPDPDELKMKRFVESLIGQGITVERAKSAFTVSNAKSIYGKTEGLKQFSAGTIVVRTAQPMGALVKAILDFDPRLNYEFLKEERRELEKYGDTRMYEVSSWSLALAWDIDGWQTTTSITVESEPISEYAVTGGRLINPDARYAFIIDMAGEKTFQALNRLFGERIVVYAAQKPFTVDGYKFNAGALSVRKRSNTENLVPRLEAIAAEIGINIVGVNTGASSDGSYLGAPTFVVLRQPKVAVLTGSPLDFSSAGVNWFVVDYELQIPHSLLRIEELAYRDLAQYNVLVMPSAWGGLSSTLGPGAVSKLKNWVNDGGTLICMGASAEWAADTSTGLSSVKLKRQALEDLGDFSRWVDREARADAPPVDTIALWYPEKAAAPKKEDEKEGGKLSKEELEDLDEWQRKFHPRGTIVRVDLDTEDWLAFGMRPQVPAILYTDQAFLSDDNVRTTARLADENDLRVSGLLWPEARVRWAKTAYAVHESSGNGQVILFAADPNTRGYFYGTRKMLVNAILYGPGMGSDFEAPYE